MSNYTSLIHAKRDALTSIIEFTFEPCEVRTDDDVRAFFTAFRAILEPFPAPRDVVICLDNIVVAVEARGFYGQERAAVAKALYRYSARYAGSPVMRIATLTSAIRYASDGTMYETREEAFAAILMLRGPL